MSTAWDRNQQAALFVQTIHGVDRLVNLVELDLSGNNIAQISGLEKCQHLQKLVLAKNKITGLDNLRSLAKLEHLLLQGNPISTIESLNLQQLCKLPRLCTLYLKNVTGAEVLTTNHLAAATGTHTMQYDNFL